MLQLLLSNLTLLAKVVNNIKLLEWSEDDGILVHSDSPTAVIITSKTMTLQKSKIAKHKTSSPYSFVREK